MIFLRELRDVAVSAAHVGSGVTKQVSITDVLRELSVAFCRREAVVYRASMQCVARVSGTGFLYDMHMPTAEVFCI
jgi:hypothetical protein